MGRRDPLSLPPYLDEEHPSDFTASNDNRAEKRASSSSDADLSSRDSDGPATASEGLLSGQHKSSPDTDDSALSSPPFIRLRLLLVISLSAAGLIFASFFFAPSLRLLFHLVSSSPSHVVDPHPVGPPGSQTDKTDHWANVGESWGVTEKPSENLAEGEEGFWNGTHWWRKTVIMVSFDGVRADYLDRGLTPALEEMGRKGIRAESMKPQFPTLTFPNHWSLLTGLHTESHGIVANDFWSPSLKKEFVYTDPKRSWDSYWWGGEPIWATAEKQGMKTANLMWPGPPCLSDNTRPTYWRPFENHYRWDKKIRHITSWLDLPLSSRPQLILAYLPEVDQTGHASGPSPSHAMDKALGLVQSFVVSLERELEARNLTGEVEVVAVSDHGMTETSDVRLVFLDELLDEREYKAIEHKEGWPSAGLRFDETVNQAAILKKLQDQAKTVGGFDVYTHDTMVPEWHFSHNDRIAPIYIVPHHGWAITDNDEYKVQMKGSYTPHGSHGYHNDEPDMQAIFVASGPFAERVKERRRRDGLEKRQVGVVEPFENVEVYGLVARLLGLKEAPHNGTAGFWDKYF